jgi:prepilin-type processing-associated H-X9-DG protein
MTRGLSELRQRPHCVGPESGLTFIEMMMAFTILLIVAAILLPVLARGREAARRVHCMNNLKQMGFVFKMIAGENDSLLPAGAPNHIYGSTNVTDVAHQMIRNNFTLDVRRNMYPERVDDLKSFVCISSRWGDQLGIRSPDGWYQDLTFAPGYLEDDVANDPRNAEYLKGRTFPTDDPECLTDQMYTYLPYAVQTEEQGIFLFLGLHHLMYTGATDMMQQDIVVPGGHAPGGSNTFHRLREGVEKYFISDVNHPEASAISSARIPVMYDTPYFNGTVDLNHIVPLGGNVLYMDGHAEFQRYYTINDKVPYSRNFMEWTCRNVFSNQPLMNVPPWCSNRTPGTQFRPRYRYYPNDPTYAGLIF